MMRAGLLTLALLCGAAWATPASAQDRVSPVDARDQAREAFKQGVAAIERGDFKAAVTALQRSYELHPHPATLLNIATAYARDGQWVVALGTYRRYLRESRGTGESDDTRTQAKRAVRDLEARVAHARITAADAPSTSEVAVDGMLIHGELPLDVPVDPGEHRFELKNEGVTLARTTVRFAEGESREVALVHAVDPAAVATAAELGTGTAPGPTAEGPTRAAPAHDADDGSVFEQWWFWTAAGAVVAAAVITGIALGGGEADPSRGNVSPSVQLP